MLFMKTLVTSTPKSGFDFQTQGVLERPIDAVELTDEDLEEVTGSFGFGFGGFGRGFGFGGFGRGFGFGGFGGGFFPGFGFGGGFGRSFGFGGFGGGFFPGFGFGGACW